MKGIANKDLDNAIWVIPAPQWAILPKANTPTGSNELSLNEQTYTLYLKRKNRLYFKAENGQKLNFEVQNMPYFEVMKKGHKIIMKIGF